MSRDAQQARVANELSRVVSDFGLERARDPAALRSILADRLGADGMSMRTEVDLVCAAASGGIPAALGNGHAHDPASLSRGVVTAGGDASGADWAVEAWRIALGVPAPVRASPIALAPTELAPTRKIGADDAPQVRQPAGGVSRVAVVAAIVVTTIVVIGLGLGAVIATVSAGSDSGDASEPGTTAGATSGSTTQGSGSGSPDKGTQAEQTRADAEAQLMKRSPTSEQTCAPLTGELGPKFEALFADGRTLAADDPLAAVRCEDTRNPDAVSDFFWFASPEAAQAAFDDGASKVLGPAESIRSTSTVSGATYPADYYVYASTEGSATAVIIRTDEDPKLVWAYSLRASDTPSVLSRLMVAGS